MDTGLLLLCEAQLGNALELKHAEYEASTLAAKGGHDSVWGKGMAQSE